MRHFVVFLLLCVLAECLHADDSGITGDEHTGNVSVIGDPFVLGDKEFRAGRFDEAYKLLMQLTSAHPRFADALWELATISVLNKRDSDAVRLFDGLLQFAPSSARAWYAKGQAHLRLNEWPQAKEAFWRAASLESKAEYLFWYAYCLGETDPERLQMLRKASKAGDEEDYNVWLAHGQIVAMTATMCDWRNWGEDLELLQGSLDKWIAEPVDVGRRMGPLMPLWTLFLPLSGKARVDVAAKMSEGTKAGVQAANIPAIPQTFSKSLAGGRLRIGYVFAYVGNHVTSLFLQSMVCMHDRSRFEVFLYTQKSDEGTMSQAQMSVEVEHYRVTKGMDWFHVSELIYKDGISVLFYLDPFILGDKAEVYATRPAPLVVQYFGIAGTTGATYVDYVISDRIATPPEHASLMTEHISMLPDPFVYLVSNHRQQHLKGNIPDYGPMKPFFNLPPNQTIFAAFHTHYKITPEIFAVWTNILRRVGGGSILWLYSRQADANLKIEMKAAGLDPDVHLRLAPPMSHALGHLPRLTAADVFLDAPIYNAHTTLVDCLWAGVPAVAMAGEHMASRVAASVLHSSGVGIERVMSVKAYEDMAVNLGRDIAFREALRERLLAERMGSALFDTQDWTRQMETSLQMMWDVYVAGYGPSDMAGWRTR